MKNVISELKTVLVTFRGTFEKIGLLFVPAFGHTVRKSPECGEPVSMKTNPIAGYADLPKFKLPSRLSSNLRFKADSDKTFCNGPMLSAKILKLF